MSDSVFNITPSIIRTFNVTRIIEESISTTTSQSLVEHTATMSTQMNSLNNTEISLAACIGFAILILTTVGGNTLVLLALYLDKRLHTPSFYLIANMAIADLLLGLFVLPFSSVLELLDGRWIFGQSFCSAWLAIDVVCCTASIIALMGVSMDRYIGVTRPLTYSSIMTTRRTIYLVLIVWAVSIVTSVVPLFGLTDREKPSNDFNATQEYFETCKVNKNTFYTIFSSMISFYIPVVILLILYSRVYQEAKKQGEKLENEKRRLNQIDYQIAAENARRRLNQANGHSNDKKTIDQQMSRNKRTFSSIPDVHSNEVATTLLNNGVSIERQSSLDPTLNLKDDIQFKKDYAAYTNNNDDTIQSGTSLAHYIVNARRFLGKRISSTLRRNSQTYLSHSSHCHHNGQMSRNDELLIIRRKMHNLKREKKAFRTLGLILGALLICWLPFFVTLPLISLLKHNNIITAENTENTWFKITFWLGYCNSALNPFVYAFSNRAIRRAFRELLFRRFCCCGLQCWLCRYLCPNKSDTFSRQSSNQYRREASNSLATETLQVSPRRACSLSTDLLRVTPRTIKDFHISTLPSIASVRTSGNEAPVVSFSDILTETAGDEISSNDDKRATNESKLASHENTLESDS